MPVTGLAMAVCALSMIGLPPFAGFFSKWYLALGAIQNGQYFYVAVLVVSSLLGAIYFFRIFEKLFMNGDAELEDHYPAAEHGGKEVPLRMMIPLLMAATIIILLGLGNSFVVGMLENTVLEVFLG